MRESVTAGNLLVSILATLTSILRSPVAHINAPPAVNQLKNNQITTANNCHKTRPLASACPQPPQTWHEGMPGVSLNLSMLAFRHTSRLISQQQQQFQHLLNTRRCFQSCADIPPDWWVVKQVGRRTFPALAAAQDADMVALQKRIGFMGAGQMAEALARGLIDKGVVDASQICCSDPAGTRKELFRSLGATPYDTNLEVGGGGEGRV